jgi:hypothetical protein
VRDALVVSGEPVCNGKCGNEFRVRARLSCYTWKQRGCHLGTFGVDMGPRWLAVEPVDTAAHSVKDFHLIVLRKDPRYLLGDGRSGTRTYSMDPKDWSAVLRVESGTAADWSCSRSAELQTDHS